MAGDKIKFSTGTVVDSDGNLYQAGTKITATAAELNALDGITATVGELNTVALTTRIDDISTASSAFVVSPFAGTLSKVYSVIDGAISGADAVLTANVNGGSDVTATITIANASSAAGDIDSCTPADNNTVAVGDYLKITTSGASTGTVSAVVTFVITL